MTLIIFILQAEKEEVIADRSRDDVIQGQWQEEGIGGAPQMQSVSFSGEGVPFFDQNNFLRLPS